MGNIFASKNLTRLQDAIRIVSAIEDAEQNRFLGYRYLLHIEDEPTVWGHFNDDPHLATTSLRKMVAARQEANGAGCGAVLDLETNTLIAVEEIRWPEAHELETVVRVIREWHEPLCWEIEEADRAYITWLGSDRHAGPF